MFNLVGKRQHMRTANYNLLLVVLILVNNHAARAAKAGCNIKSKKKKENFNRNISKRGNAINMKAKESELDLSDFNYDSCHNGLKDNESVKVDVQLSPEGPVSEFLITKDSRNSKALRGKGKRKDDKGDELLGEINMVTGEQGDIAGSAQLNGTIYQFGTFDDGSTWSLAIQVEDLPMDDPADEDSDKYEKPGYSDRKRLLSSPTNVLEFTKPVSNTGDDSRLLTELPTIDVLVPYTMRALCAIFQEAAPDAPCIASDRNKLLVKSRIELAIQESNVAFENSGIPGQVRLAYAYLVEGYDELNFSYSDMLNHLTGVDGVLDDVHSIRDKYQADVVSFWTDNPTSCGRANSGSPVPKKWAFSAINWICGTGYYTFIHEIAHMLGARHDRITQDCAGQSCCNDQCYNYGYLDPQSRFRSIMAYNCPNAFCPRIQMFSQPDYKFTLSDGLDSRSYPVGTSYENNARTIRENFITVANFYESQTLPLQIFNPAPVSSPIKTTSVSIPFKAPVKPPVSAPVYSVPVRSPTSPLRTRCGNGICEPSLNENCKTCPQDCIGGVYRNSKCNNGICEAGENCHNCPQDCPSRFGVRSDLQYCCIGGSGGDTSPIQHARSCTDKYCQFNAFCNTSPPFASSYCCGNGRCELGENVKNCSADCQCINDGRCDWFEDETCADCQSRREPNPRCMATGRFCNKIFVDPCCGKCDSTTKQCVVK